MKRTIFKKLLLTVLVLVISLPFSLGALAAEPSDFVDFPTGWSNEAVTAAVANGLLNGRTASTIEPESNLTRAEMATIINRAFGATIEKNISAFGDVSPNEWYYHEIAKAYNMQTFQGDDTVTMRPDAFITREEVFAVIARALVLETNDYSPLAKFNDSYAVSEWAKPYASILVAKGYVNGDNLGNLNPLANITREEFAQIMHNIVKTYHVTAGTHTYAGPDSTLIRVGGVTLSNVTVEGDLILGDGVGKGDVTLINVTIKGRLLARGGEGKVTLKNTTVAGGVVVKDVNGVVNFNNYRTEAPFKGIREITKATFKPLGGGGSYRPSTPESKTSYKVTFYEGPVADSSAKKAEKTVESGKTMAQIDIDDVLSKVNSAGQKIEYIDGEGAILHENTIRPELWYEAEAGKWERFDDTVAIKSDMNVYYTKKVISLFTKLKSVNKPISFSVPYQTDTRLITSLKDAMSLARIQIKDALGIEDYYAKAIKKAAELSAKKTIELDGVKVYTNIIDADGNIKFANIDVAISNIIDADEIDDEIEKYIRNIIVENDDDSKLESAIKMVYDSTEIKNDIFGGAVFDFSTIKSHITSLTREEREVLAEKVHDLLAAKDYYDEFIDAFKNKGKEFVVTHENLDFVMAVATAVNEYTYEYLKDKIAAKFGKVIELLGEPIVKAFMRDAQDRYYDGVHVIWDDMKAHSSDETYKSSYPSYLTFKVDPIRDVFKPIYDTYHTKIVNKLTQKNFYYYAQNSDLQHLVGDKTADALIDDLLRVVPAIGENVGYSLVMEENGESGFMYYYDYLFENLLTLDKALLWYGDSLSDTQLEELKTDIYGKIAKILNKANEMLEAYETDGSLPMGKNISDLKEIPAFAKIFAKVEGKLVEALERFKETEFYDKDWTAESVKNDIPNAEVFANVIFGTDEPVYNIDSLMDDEYVGKAFSKAGFTKFTDDYDATWGTVTIQAIERTLKGNTIKIRRTFEK